MTSYLLTATLPSWALIAIVLRHVSHQGNAPKLEGCALLALGMVVAWFAFVARPTLAYLVPVLTGAVTSFLRLISGGASGKVPFRSTTGQFDPLWERVVGFAAVGLILLELPRGARQIWHRYRMQPIALVLAVAALGYPASLALRLSRAGTETSNRASEFLFVGIGFVLAVGVAGSDLAWSSRFSAMLSSSDTRLFTVMFAVGAVIVSIGGVVIGWAPYARLPGPYIVAADPRSISLQGVAAAQWVRAQLTPGNFIATDETNAQLLGSYGRQTPQAGAIDGQPVSTLFFSPMFGEPEQEIIRGDKIRYVVSDYRLSGALPLIGTYYDRNEPDAYQHTTPITHAVLAKFDDVRGIDRVFDSGDIVMYDVGALSR